MSIRDNLGGSAGSTLDTMEEIAANTESGKKAGALALKEFSGGVTEFVVDETTGKISGYKTGIGGADTLFPFSGSKTALLALNAAPVTTSNAQGGLIFANEDYFDTTDGFVCTRACSGIVYIRRHHPMVNSSNEGKITINIKINDETIYSLTASSVNTESVAFSCNAGDIVTMTAKSSGSSYGRAPVCAVFVGA